MRILIYSKILKKMYLKTRFVLVCFCFAIFWSSISEAQTLESVTFSAVASGNDNLQLVMGAPYGASLLGANGSLEISASYGEDTYEETTLSTQEIVHRSSIQVYPNPSSYHVYVDLSQLPVSVYQILLIDLTGKTVLNQSTTAPREEIDLLPYTTGIYILQVLNAQHDKVETFKIVKNK